MSDEHKTVQVYLVVAGDYHDMDHARLELLKLLAEHESMRVQVAGNYNDLDAIAASDMLISYTCNLVPELHQQEALRDYVKSGKKWFALHGTNSILEFTDDGVAAPETAPVLMETLGTQFLAHPPIQPFTVTASDPEHELVKGVGEFETDDELYLCRIHGDLHYLLETRFVGEATGFVLADWPDDVPHPVGSWDKPEYYELLRRGLRYCAGMPV